MKKIIPFFAAALMFAAPSCLDLDPDKIDGEIASVDVKDVNFSISIPFEAKRDVDAGHEETVVFGLKADEKATIENYLKNYNIKGNVEIVGEVDNQAFSSITVSCVFKGVNGKNVPVKLNGKDSASFGAGVKTPLTLSFTEETGFNTIGSIEFHLKTDAAVKAGQKVFFKTKTLSASAAVTVK